MDQWDDRLVSEILATAKVDVLEHLARRQSLDPEVAHLDEPVEFDSFQIRTLLGHLDKGLLGDILA